MWSVSEAIHRLRVADEKLFPYPPRGIPPDCSSDVRDLFFVSADVVEEYLAYTRLEEEEETSLEEYAKGYGNWAVNEYKTHGHLPTPETLDSGWLNLNELKEALAHRGLEKENLSTVFRAVIAAMEVLAEEYSADKVRLVFWFGM